MNPFPRSIPLREPEIGVYRFPRRKIIGQLPPRTARTHDIQHHIDHLAHVMTARATTPLGRRDRRLDQSPLTLRHVGWVGLPYRTPLSAKSGLLKHFLREFV